MAFDAFIKIDGITGEAEDHKHKDEIEVLSYSWSVAQTGTSASGSGAGSGKCEVANFEFSKKTDKSSPILFMKCATGEHIASALFTVRKAGGTQLEFLKYKFTDVVIAKYKSGGSGSGDDIPTEDIELNFTKCEIDYQAQDNKGAAKGGPVHGGWNVKENKTA